MANMFFVRSPRVPCPKPSSRGSSACASLLPPPLPHAKPHAPQLPRALRPAHLTRVSHSLPSTRHRERTVSTSRWASTRPASRSCTACSWCAPPRVPCPQSRLLRVRATLAPAPAPRPTFRPAHLAPYRMPFHSAAHVGVQPAGELRHVQRHGDELHVLRALRRACLAPTQPSSATGTPRALLAPAAAPRPPELDIGRAPRALPSALQSRVLRVRAACARPSAPRPSSPAFRPAHLARHRTPCFRLGRKRRLSTSH